MRGDIVCSNIALFRESLAKALTKCARARRRAHAEILQKPSVPEGFRNRVSENTYKNTWFRNTDLLKQLPRELLRNLN